MTYDYWKQIDQRMCDFHAYYDQIAEELPNESRIAEVGVADGASAIYLASKLREKGKTFTLYMIDGLQYGGVNQLNTLMKHIVRSGLAEFIELMPLDSLNASTKFNDNYFHFVFLDSGHTYNLTKCEILCWERKVSYGCKLSGHDMNPLEGIGVFEAVNELIPKIVINTANGDERPEEKVLNIISTEKGLGIWEYTKQWYGRLLPQK